MENETNFDISNLDLENENTLYGNSNCNDPERDNGNIAGFQQNEVPERHGETLGLNQITKKRKKFNTSREERTRMKIEQMKILHSVKPVLCEKAGGFCKKKCG